MRSTVAALLALALSLGPVAAAAQEEASRTGAEPIRTVPGTDADAPRLSLELNHLETLEDGQLCRLSLVAENDLGTEIEDLQIELALFDEGGRVDDMLVLQLGRLPAGKTRVRQYDIEAPGCRFSRILVNEVTSCSGEGLTAAGCLDSLEVTGRAGVPFLT